MDPINPIRAIIVGAGFKDVKGKFMSSTHCFAEVVLIDNTHQGLSPLLFQLNDESIIRSEDLSSMPKDLISIPRDAFMMVGEVVSFDKKKKLIYLANNYTVGYNYLILASGTKSSTNAFGTQSEEFLIGLYALIDALKLKKITTNFSELQSSYSGGKITRYTTFDVSSKNIPKDIINVIARTKNEGTPSNFNGLKKCMFEVVT